MMRDGPALLCARSQRGAALLIVTLMLVAGASILFASRFESDSVRLARAAADAKVLFRAKQALIARAAVGANRPGGLPCPDTDNNGEEELNCGEIGRLPWRTLDVPELRDSAGAKLWYAVSPNYLNRAASEPLNSDVPGQLSLDGADGIVALVFAPGAPLGAQTLRAANPNDVVQFLDGVNAVADGDYTAALSATQNDLVLPITVAEIMRDVHKRVTAAAADLVSRHLATYGFSNYLWLAPFDNPATSNLMARTTVLQGHIPLHVAGQNYTSDYTVEWSITGPGVQLNAGPNTLTQAALQENTQTVAAGICRNAGGPLDQFSCDPANAVQTNGLPAGVDTRTFEFNLPSFFSDSGYDIRPPAASRVGSRNVSVENAVFAASPAWVIRITDRDAGANVLGGGTITFDNVTNGDLAVNGIHLAPQIDPGGDYAWYLNNNWHALVYMSVAPGYAPGQANTCAIGCLTLLNGPPPIDNKPAVLLVAGAPLAGPRPSADLRDYFEGENANEDTVFAVNFVSPVFNDSVRTLAGP